MVRVATAVAAALGLLAGRAGGQTHVGPEYIPTADRAVPLWLDPGKQAEVATCSIDVGISLVFLGHAGTSINAAVQTCDRQETDQEKAACAATVAGVVASFGYAAGFLSEAAAECQRSFQVVNPVVVAKAACGADIANFISSLSLLASAGASLRAACGKDQRVLPEDGILMPDRRLGELAKDPQALLLELTSRNLTAVKAAQRELEGPLDGHKLVKNVQYPGEPTEADLKNRGAEIASCVFDVGQATLFFARAALMINSAVADCSRFEQRTGGEAAHAKCAVDVSSVISAFAFVSSGISFAAYHCAFWSSLAPACAGGVSNLIAALAQIAASGASFEGTCGYQGQPAEFRGMPQQYV